MDALIDIRERMTPMMALTGAMAIATAAVVSAPSVQHAAERVVPLAVHEVKSLPLQLTSGVDFFAPYYYQPAGPLGDGGHRSALRRDLCGGHFGEGRDAGPHRPSRG